MRTAEVRHLLEHANLDWEVLEAIRSGQTPRGSRVRLLYGNLILDIQIMKDVLHCFSLFA